MQFLACDILIMRLTLIDMALTSPQRADGLPCFYAARTWRCVAIAFSSTTCIKLAYRLSSYHLQYLRTTMNLFGRRAGYYSGNFDDLWELTPRPTFEHLTTLHFTGISCSPSNAIDFLSRHRSLRSVRAGISRYSPTTPNSDYFGQIGLGPGDLPTGCLPEIEEFVVFGMENAFEALLEDGTSRPNYRLPEHKARLVKKGKHKS